MELSLLTRVVETLESNAKLNSKLRLKLKLELSLAILLSTILCDGRAFQLLIPVDIDIPPQASCKDNEVYFRFLIKHVDKHHNCM